jgi:hypothetical protein
LFKVNIFYKYMNEGMHYLCICVGCLWFQEKPYIDATPDAVVGCACCGDGLLEIKWPQNIAHLDPNVKPPT